MQPTDWELITAGALVISVAWAGVLLTLATLPGTWLAVLVATACWVWKPEMLGWWSIGGSLALAVVGEVLESVASGVGAAKAGGGRSSVVGGIIGGLLGAVLGTVFLPIPIVGTIVGAVVGAGLGAGLAERGAGDATWRESASIAKGAALGRLMSVFLKGVIALLIAVILTLGVVL